MLDVSRLRRLGGRSLLIAVTVVGFGAALSQVDHASLWSALRNISVISLMIVATALVAGAVLAAFRFKLIAGDMGYPLSLRDAVAAMSVGQIAGTIFFQFFGQIAGRSAMLGSRGISVPANVMITTYERLIACGVSAILAIAGAWFLFGHVVVDLDIGGDKLLRIAAGITIAVAAGAALAWGRFALNAVRPLANRRMLFVLGRTVAFTLVVQLATALAYVLAARAIVPEAGTLDVLAASVVVMFAASLPISFSGWGVREMSAVLALSLIGVSSGAALTISVMIGLLALAVVIALALFALATPTPKLLPQSTKERSAEKNVDIDGLIAWILPLTAATAIFFQIYIPSGDGQINVNLADPVAILGGIIFITYFLGKSWPQWRLPDLNFYVIAATAVVVLSFLHGYFEFGWSDWAFRNKTLGWFVLLGYGASGALIVRHAGRRGLEVLITTFIAVAAAIVASDLAMILATRADLLPSSIVKLPMEGFSQNRNAFALMLLLAICGTPFLSSRARPWLLAVLLLGVWFSGSRAGGGAMLIVLATMVVTGFLSYQTLLRAVLTAGAFLLMVAALPMLLSAHPGSHYPVWVMGMSQNESILQRWQSIVGGIALFENSPIIGAGLGAFMEAQIKAGEPLVIHSTPIWLLAEMGVVGFCVLALPTIRLFFSEARALREEVGAFLILIIIAFVITSSVHEMLYQRAFWLLLGAAMALVPSVRTLAAPAARGIDAGAELLPTRQGA